MTRNHRSAALGAGLAMGLLALGACGSTGSPAPGAATSAPDAVASQGVSASQGTPTSVPAGMFVNPVITDNYPDPALLEADGTFYLYATEGEGGNVQVRTSTDLITWTAGPDALPTLGDWALTGKTWAPEVLKAGEKYVLFYTASDIESGKQCIGRAEAASPAGPFVDKSAKPFVCQAEDGGSIDANPVADSDGKLYLFWKNDGNCCGATVHLYGQQLDATAAKLVGKPVALLTVGRPWEGDLIEAPQMVEHDGKHYLFYAANGYATDKYAEGYATCEGPLGPCVPAQNPILVTNADAAGPGHGYVFTVGKQTWIIYHAWPPDGIGFVVPGRQVWLDRVEWGADGPTVSGPTAAAQELPRLT